MFQASVSDSSHFTFYQRLCSAFAENAFKDSPASLSTHIIRSSKSPEYVHALKSFIADEQENRAPSRSAVPELRHSFGDEGASTSSDNPFVRPPKRMKRSSSQDNLSFVISAKPDRLSFADIAKDSSAPSDDVAIPTFTSDLDVQGDSQASFTTPSLVWRHMRV